MTPAPEASSRRSPCLAIDVLDRQRFFADLDSGQLERLAGLFLGRRLAGGQEIFRQGEPSDSLFLVGDGSVTVFRDRPDGSATMVARLGSGALFGEFGLLSGLPRSASARTDQPSWILRAGADDVRAFLEDYPELLSRLRILAARRHSLNALSTLRVPPGETPWPAADQDPNAAVEHRLSLGG